MDESIGTAAISPLRQRLIDDMKVRRFSRATQHDYIRDARCFQIEQRCRRASADHEQHRVGGAVLLHAPIDRADLARKLIRVEHPRNLLWC